jgi:hypothetical protein
MRIRSIPGSFFLPLVLLCISFYPVSGSETLDNSAPKSRRERPSSGVFTTEDPYKGVTYEQRPEVGKETRILTVTDLLKSTVPTFWKHKTSLADGLEVNRLTDIKNQIALHEAEIIRGIQQVPGIMEILDDNKDQEAEIQHFLTLRRAELQNIHKQLKKLKQDLEDEKHTKSTGLSDVQDKIKKLYDEIDIHLEGPGSTYNDDFVSRKKKSIRRLMTKKRNLRRDFERLDYPKMKALRRKIEFLEERRREIHDKSKGLSFSYIQRRVKRVEKNNARINYLVSIHLDRTQIQEVQAKLGRLREVRKKLASVTKDATEEGREKLDLEADIRFEEKYYDQVARREGQILDEIRRTRETVHGLRSKERVQVGDSKIRSQAKTMGRTQILDSKTEASDQHVYVVPLQSGITLPTVAELPRLLKERAGISRTETPPGVVYLLPMGSGGRQVMAPGYASQKGSQGSQAEIRNLVQEVQSQNDRKFGALKDSLSSMMDLMRKQGESLGQLIKDQERVQGQIKVIKSVNDSSQRPEPSKAKEKPKEKKLGLQEALEKNLEDEDRFGYE